tara:strand:+ start:682 stop:924 length:243 start_codon:yes stop_codon:yes gene_type:complete
MDFKFNVFEKWVVIFAIVIIISGGVNGCAKKPIQDIVIDPKVEDTQVQEKEPTTAETIGKIPGIVDALGCMFAPDTCKKQ